jgi:hypothetical protein
MKNMSIYEPGVDLGWVITASGSVICPELQTASSYRNSYVISQTTAIIVC